MSNDRRTIVPHPASRSAAWYRISAEQGYLRAELFDRQTADETREFLSAVLAGAWKQGQSHVLIYVHGSRPIFAVEKYGLYGYLKIASASGCKVALLADSAEARVAQQYIETLARQRGVDLRTFRDESAALEWLKSERGTPPGEPLGPPASRPENL